VLGGHQVYPQVIEVQGGLQLYSAGNAVPGESRLFFPGDVSAVVVPDLFRGWWSTSLELVHRCRVEPVEIDPMKDVEHFFVVVVPAEAGDLVQQGEQNRVELQVEPSDVLAEVLTAGESQVLHVVRELGADPQQLLHRRQQLRR